MKKRLKAVLMLLAAACMVLAGAPKVSAAQSFEDVPKSASYYSAVYWAVGKGIVSGTSATTFSPNKACTRYQFAVMLYKFAGKPAVQSGDLPFTDVSKKASYYKAVSWAYKNGIISGTSKTTFSPDAPVKRYQAVQMLYKYAGKPAVSKKNPFDDVKKEDSFYNAVMWAVKNKITSGTTATTFSPQSNCLRYQVVVFLKKFDKLINGGQTGEPTGEKTKITVYRCLYNRSYVTNTQVKKVQDAINTRLDELGEPVEIEIHEIASAEYSDKVTMALARGEINLLWNASWWGGGINCNDLWRTKAAYDITDLLPGTLLYDAMPEGVWEASKYDGKVLFVPVYKEMYEGYDMKAPKLVVERVGQNPAFPEVTSQDNWYDRMAAFDGYLQKCVDNGIPYPYMACQFFYRIALDDYDFFGGGSSLLAIDRKTNKVVNGVATEDYRKWAHLMRDWYDKGYINDDILYHSTPQGLNKTQDWGLQFWTNVPGDSLWNSQIRDEQEEIMIEGITKWWTHSDTTLGSCYTVTSNCTEEQAEACVAFLGRLYTDTKLADLYTYGIKGEDYNVRQGRVVVNNYGTYCHSAWESTSIVPLTLMEGDPADKVQSYIDHNNAAETSCAAGFRFDKRPVEAEWSACQNLNRSYGEPLELGSPVINGLEDVDEIIDAYLAALDSVGYQKVLAEAKRQYAEWCKLVK